MRVRLAIAIALAGTALLLAHTAAAGNVNMTDSSYVPATITIQQGDTITWTNDGLAVHTATSEDGLFDTGDVANGESKTVAEIADLAPGSYAYLCNYHEYKGGTITVETPENAPPVADFTFVTENMTVSVDARGSNDADGTIVAYLWSWGDGGSEESSAVASHTYPTAGQYTLRLEVRDDRGANATTEKNVTVGEAARVNQAPAVSFTHSADGLTVTVDGSGSTDPDGTIVSYAWSWGDLSTDAAGPTANHTYPAPGNYSVRLTVTDNEGLSAEASRVVTVERLSAENIPPVAVFSGTTRFLTLSVTAAESFDPDGAIVAYAWDWGDESPPGTGMNATHSYSIEGNKTVRLTVRDNQEASAETSRTFTLSRENSPPTLMVDSPRERDNVSGPFEVRGTASDPDGDEVVVTVQMGVGEEMRAAGSTEWILTVNASDYPAGSIDLTVRATDGLENTSVRIPITIIHDGSHTTAPGEGGPDGDATAPDTENGTDAPPEADVRLSVIVTKPSPGELLPEPFFTVAGRVEPSSIALVSIDVDLDALRLASATGSAGLFAFDLGTPILSPGDHVLRVTARFAGESTATIVHVRAAGIIEQHGTDVGAAETHPPPEAPAETPAPAVVLAALAALVASLLRRRR